MRRLIAGLATAVLLSGGVAAAGTAQAQPGFAPLARWCPGQPVPQAGLDDQSPVVWDMTVCHNYYYLARPDGRLVEGIRQVWVMCGRVPCPVSIP
jgi:hypothetical protein